MIEWIISSSVLILAVLAVRLALKNHMAPRLRYALWAVVLVRLLLPIPIGSTAISIMNTAERVPAVQAVESVRQVQTIEHAADGSVWGFDKSDYMCDFLVEVVPHSTPEQFQRMESALSVREVLLPLWKLGVAVVLAVLLLSNARFGVFLQKHRRRLEQDDIPLSVYVCDGLDTPCLFGLLSPAVYVTAEVAEDETALRHALAHEYTHFRQGDHFWAFLRGICLALHWYHPLVWLAARLSRLDGELSCDEGTVRRLGETERAAYGRTLVRLTCRTRRNPLSAATTMTGSTIQERITLLVKHPRTAVETRAAVLLVTAIVVGCTFTSAKEPEMRGENGPFTVFHCDGVNAAILTEQLDPLEVQICPDVEHGVLLKVWEKASREAAKADGLQEEQGWLMSLVRYDQTELDAAVAQSTAQMEVVARDPNRDAYYAIVTSNDGPYRSDGVTQEDWQVWYRLTSVPRLMQADFHGRNPNLIPLERTDQGFQEADLPEIIPILQSLKAGDLQVSVYPYWYPERVDELARVLVQAAEHPVTNRTDLAAGPLLSTLEPVWQVEAERGEMSRILLSCWPEEEPLVSVAVWDGGPYDTICLEDQALYDLVRHSRDGIRAVDQELYRQHKAILDDAAAQIWAQYQKTQPGTFTDCELVQLTHAFTWEESAESRVEVYDVDFALTTDQLEAVQWEGNLYLDGDFRIRGAQDFGQLAVRYRNGKPTVKTFLGQRHYYAPWEDHSKDWEEAAWVLDQAEFGRENPVYVDYEKHVSGLGMIQNYYTGDSGPDTVKVVFRSKIPVYHVRYFVVEYDRVVGDMILPTEHQTLYEIDELSQDCPLLVDLPTSKALPLRGIAFRIGSTEYRYMIGESRRDGTIPLYPMDD